MPRALAETAAVLLLAALCDREGLFEAAGRWMATTSQGRPLRLLGLVFVVGSAVTAALSLDATVVLLTPVVFATAARVRLRAKPHMYACTHLANSASLLLPVSNLTNLLAFRASGLSFARFAALMVLPWLAAIAVEWLVLRRFFASDLVGRGETVAKPGRGAPGYPVAVVCCTLVGFALASPIHLDRRWWQPSGPPPWRSPRWPAGGCISAVWLVRWRCHSCCSWSPFAWWYGPSRWLGSLVTRLVPAGGSLWALLGVAVVTAVQANLVNNLPAVLLLLPAATVAGPGTVLAALIGVNVGPTSPTSARWPPCCGGGCCASATPSRRWASS